MKNYEVTFIVDPVLSGDEISATAQAYVDHLQKVGCTIVHVDEMGLQQLAYPINRRTSGVYYCIEVSSENGIFIKDLEVAMIRDERIMRFLTVALDKYGVKYNQDKRDGKIGKVKKKEKKDKRDSRGRSRGGRPERSESASKTKTETPVKEAPVKEAPAAEKPEAKQEEE